MKLWSALVFCAFLIPGCGLGGDVDVVASRIQGNERALRPLLVEDELDEAGQALVAELLRDYARYANVHHGDSLAGVFLMRRADLLQGMGEHEAAVEQWVNVAEGGGSPLLAAEAVFRVGFVRETALKDTVGALKAYGEVVRVYPESQWASAAIEAAKWLSFSEREMLRALEGESD